MSVTILLGDDHPLVRRGIRGLLEAEQDFAVVGEAEDGLAVVQLAEKFQPQVLVVDMMMPNLNGLEALKQVSHRSPKTRKIVLSMQSAEPYVVEAFRSGALGYVLKDSAPNELIQAIRTSLDGSRYVSPKLPERLVNALLEARGDPEPSAYDTLTEREREVLQMGAEGKTAPQIAKILSISPRTAELHRSRMMDKMGFRNQAEVVRFAVKRGILPLDD